MHKITSIFFSLSLSLNLPCFVVGSESLSSVLSILFAFPQSLENEPNLIFYQELSSRWKQNSKLCLHVVPR